MILPDATRRQIILSSEAAVLRGASDSSDAVALAVARCQVDGLVNGMVRLEGAPATALYVFALSDRVAAGLPAPTDFRAADAGAPAAADAPRGDGSYWGYVFAQSHWGYVFGLIHGAVLALYLRWLLP